MEIQKFTGSMCVATDISNLRANGIDIPPAKYIGRTPEGRKKYMYRINRNKEA